MANQSQDLGWTFDGFDIGTLGEVAPLLNSSRYETSFCTFVLRIN